MNKTLSGTKLRKLLDNGDDIPKWFTIRSYRRVKRFLGLQLLKEDLQYFLQIIRFWEINIGQWFDGEKFLNMAEGPFSLLMVIL